MIESLIISKIEQNKKLRVNIILKIIKTLSTTLNGGTFANGIQLQYSNIIQNASNRLIKIVCSFFSSLNVNQLKQAINTTVNSDEEMSYDRLMAVYNQIGGTA